ncbi:MAG: hypothetical protein WBD34_14810 [Burkholderiaceae bacterium]
MSGDSCQRTLRPSASKEYVTALLAFMRSESYKGYSIDSFVTPHATQAAEQAIVEFYTSDTISNAISDEFLKQLRSSIPVDKVVKDGITENSEWIKKETSLLVKGDAASSIAIEATNLATDQIADFFSTAAGQAIIATISQALATASGKMMLKNIIVAVVKKVASSAIIKTTIFTTLKKVGIAALMKTVIGKAIIATFAVFGITAVPIAWVLIPLIGAFLIYEYTHFPDKLASKVPSEVVSSLRSHFGKINTSIVDNIVKQAWDLLQIEITKVRKKST